MRFSSIMNFSLRVDSMIKYTLKHCVFFLLTPFRFIEWMLAFCLFHCLFLVFVVLIYPLKCLTYLQSNTTGGRMRRLLILQHGFDSSSDLETNPTFRFFFSLSSLYDETHVVNPFGRIDWKSEFSLNNSIRTIRLETLTSVFSKLKNVFFPLLNTIIVLDFYSILIRLVFRYRRTPVTVLSMTHNWVGVLAVSLSKMFHNSRSIIEIRGNYELLNQLHGETVFWHINRHFRSISSLIFKLEKKYLKLLLQKADLVLCRNYNIIGHVRNIAGSKVNLVVNRTELHPLQEKLLESSFVSQSSGFAYDGIFVGRLSHEKYPFDVLIAWRKVLESRPNSRLLMVGDGPLLRELKAYVIDNDLVDNVQFYGKANNSEAIELLKKARVGIETYGGSTLLEKGISGCAVVAYDVEWHSELLVNGSNGFLVAFRDTSGLAKRVLDLLHNEELRQQFGKVLFQICQKEYDRNTWWVNEVKIHCDEKQ